MSLEAIAALDSEATVAQEEVRQIVTIDPFRVKVFNLQPRKRFRNIEALAEGINKSGQTTPVLLMLLHNDPQYDAQLIDGERRLRACQLLNRPIRGEVHPPCSEDEQLEKSVAANFGREGHDALETAEIVLALKERGKTLDEIAAICNHSKGWVQQYLSLWKLDEAVRTLLVIPEETKPSEGVIPKKRKFHRKTRLTFSLALLLTSLSVDLQLKAAHNITTKELSLAAARRYVLNLQRKSGVLSERNSRDGHKTKERVDNLVSLLERTRESIGIYNDMPSSEFDDIFVPAAPLTRKCAIGEGRKLIKDLEVLLSALESASKKQGV